jgi:hypothetical protein
MNHTDNEAKEMPICAARRRPQIIRRIPPTFARLADESLEKHISIHTLIIQQLQVALNNKLEPATGCQKSTH